jgi:RNA-binding protein PNO1
MAHKSHRQKALQSQLEERPAISLVEPKKSKKVKSTTIPTIPDEPVASSSTMDLDQPIESTSTEAIPEDDDEVMISAPTPSAVTQPPAQASSSGFAPLPASAQSGVLKNEFRRITIPPHRMSPLKKEWVNLYTPLVEMLGLQVRMNVKRRCVELKVGLSISFTPIAAVMLKDSADNRLRIIQSIREQYRKEQIS